MNNDAHLQALIEKSMQLQIIQSYKYPEHDIDIRWAADGGPEGSNTNKKETAKKKKIKRNKKKENANEKKRMQIKKKMQIEKENANKTKT